MKYKSVGPLVRVNKKRRCPVCGKVDWCSVSQDGEIAICMRSQSDKPTRNGGWLHNLKTPVAPYVPPKKVVEERPVDIEALWRGWSERTDYHHLDGFAMSLGVDTDALRSLGCAWSGQAWAFPMRNSTGQVIGVRLRNNEGRKWAVKGSRQGLFIPEGIAGQILYVVEGPTDAAAALTIGLDAVGRPSCIGCEEMFAEYLRQCGAKRVVIVADNDDKRRSDGSTFNPGLDGAQRLAKSLRVRSAILCLPTKDIRDFVLAGGTKVDIDNILKDTVWQ